MVREKFIKIRKLINILKSFCGNKKILKVGELNIIIIWYKINTIINIKIFFILLSREN